MKGSRGRDLIKSISPPPQVPDSKNTQRLSLLWFGPRAISSTIAFAQPLQDQPSDKGRRFTEDFSFGEPNYEGDFDSQLD